MSSKKVKSTFFDRAVRPSDQRLDIALAKNFPTELFTVAFERCPSPIFRTRSGRFNRHYGVMHLPHHHFGYCPQRVALTLRDLSFLLSILIQDHQLIAFVTIRYKSNIQRFMFKMQWEFSRTFLRFGLKKCIRRDEIEADATPESVQEFCYQCRFAAANCINRCPGGRMFMPGCSAAMGQQIPNGLAPVLINKVASSPSETCVSSYAFDSICLLVARTAPASE